MGGSGSWIEHKGKRVLFHDYTGLFEEKAMAALEGYQKFVEDIDAKRIPLLLDITGAIANDEILERFKVLARQNVENERFSKVAVIGAEGVLGYFVHLVNKSSNVGARAFESKEEALDWLVS